MREPIYYHEDYGSAPWGHGYCCACRRRLSLAIQLLGNFHEVVAGQLYRSNQPSSEQLVRYTGDNGIKTVINLRGENESEDWYKDEIKTSRELGLTHIDFGMSARHELDMTKVNQLVAIMRDAPKPILIHCKSGADRTGLATALYLGRVAYLGEKAAESAFRPLRPYRHPLSV